MSQHLASCIPLPPRFSFLRPFTELHRSGNPPPSYLAHSHLCAPSWWCMIFSNIPVYPRRIVPRTIGCYKSHKKGRKMGGRCRQSTAAFHQLSPSSNFKWSPRMVFRASDWRKHGSKVEKGVGNAGRPSS
jgi:hypothetical protein